MSELLSCPFCGGEALINRLPDESDSTDIWYTPECSRCEAVLANGWRTEAEAIAAWNRREGREESL